MVEISLSGSGEGPGGAIPRGYSTTENRWKTQTQSLVSSAARPASGDAGPIA